MPQKEYEWQRLLNTGYKVTIEVPTDADGNPLLFIREVINGRNTYHQIPTEYISEEKVDIKKSDTPIARSKKEVDPETENALFDFLKSIGAEK